MYLRIAASLAAALLSSPRAVAQAADPGPTGELRTFRNRNRTFQLELPAGWRQVAPGEALRIGEHPNAPPILRLSSPRQYYGVGPVDRWLEGDFSGPWLYVFEQRDEWHVGDDYAEQLRSLWRDHGETNGVEHALADVHLENIGTQQVECVLATRTTTPPPPAAPRRSLDVHAPTARQQITLSFVASPEQFDRWQPEFRAWLATQTFARVAPEAQTLAGRLWTPLLVGSIVGLVLVVVYRHTRSRR